MKKEVLILRHMVHEAGGTLEEALARAKLDFRYVDLYRSAPDQLPFDRASSLIVLGGAMNVDQVEQYPFLANETRWIQQAMSAKLPVLGVCLGAQLLAKSLGAKVYPNSVKEIGWHPVEFTAAAAGDPLFAQQGERIVFQWHGDTFDLPIGATLLARSRTCKHQAFRFGRLAYGLQFHIEMTATMIDSWLKDTENCQELAELDYVDPQTIRTLTPRWLPGLQTLAADILGRFAALVRRVS
ncbi:MAG: gamma-glutamyl-gamma-aminobutyrate hydrolase family protein [Thermoguttaceae bacterium]